MRFFYSILCFSHRPGLVGGNWLSHESTQGEAINVYLLVRTRVDISVKMETTEKLLTKKTEDFAHSGYIDNLLTEFVL